MKKQLISRAALAVALFVIFAATTAWGKDGCNLQGSWIGIDGAVLVVAYDGQSSSSGTAIEEVPTLVPYFPPICLGVRASSLRGVWQRTGGNTFSYTQVGYAIDENNNVACIIKNSGNKTLTEDCNLMTVESTLEIFGPGDNPFVDPPIFGMPIDTVYAYRMSVDPPYPAP